MRDVKANGASTETVTDDFLLNRRVSYRQPEKGFRTGIEPVFLAAAVPAEEGDYVLEAGSGAGAALLCLNFRLRGHIFSDSIEKNGFLAKLATENYQKNGFMQAFCHEADILTFKPVRFYHHALSNPPWYSNKNSVSSNNRRAEAKTAYQGLLQAWGEALSRNLLPGGTLTFILPAVQLFDGLNMMKNCKIGAAKVLPLQSFSGQVAKRVILQGSKGAEAAGQFLPALTLHQIDGSFTEEAEQILRQGAALSLK